MRATPTGGSLELKTRLSRSIGRDGNLLLQYTGRVPGDERILARRYLRDRERPINTRNSIVRMRHCECPAFHIGMKPTLHDENPAIFRELDGFFDRFAGQVLVAMRPDV